MSGGDKQLGLEALAAVGEMLLFDRVRPIQRQPGRKPPAYPVCMEMTQDSVFIDVA
jgi:hypothetical protein